MLGYEVEKTNAESVAGAVAYVVSGKRGGKWELVRDARHPHLMYARSLTTRNIVGLKGNYTFTDRDGTLRPFYGHW